ncbi:hypothetical protein B0H14DRAFT_2705864, partial [Mycena olivaceomarginata]
MASTGHLALVTGLVSSSYFTFANVGAGYFGIIAACHGPWTDGTPRRREAGSLGLLIYCCKGGLGERLSVDWRPKLWIGA